MDNAVEYVDETGLLFRSYRKGGGSVTDGLQVYRDGVIGRRCRRSPGIPDGRLCGSLLLFLCGARRRGGAAVYVPFQMAFRTGRISSVLLSVLFALLYLHESFC